LPNLTDAPECPHCRKPCHYVEAWNGGAFTIPAHYSKTCGASACEAAAEKLLVKAPIVAPDPARFAAEQEARTQKCLAALGCPAALLSHTTRDFPEHDIPARPCNVLLCGPNGTGKSALSVALVRHWPLHAHWTSAYRILARIKSTYSKRGGETETDVLDWYGNIPLLCIDDLGAQGKTGFALAALYELVKERCENYLPNIVTTNQTLTEIDKDEPRLASRLGAFLIMRLDGEDRRLGDA
jgi:hypothetical protein